MGPPDGGEGFELRGIIDRREVAYFRFDTDRTGNVGRAVAQMVLLDLGAAASARMGSGAGTFVGIDEFGALEAPALERLFTRGRAAGFSVALGTQTLADLSAAGQGVRERVGATISAIICHRIGEQGDAEWVAQLIGAVPTWQNTVRTDGLGRPTPEGTRTRGYRFEVNPSQLQRLGRGEACVARLDETGAERSSRVEVVPAWERLAGRGPDEICKRAARPSEREAQMNTVAMVGNLTKDPELKSANGGAKFCVMRVAESNGPKSSPNYINVKIFGRDAENSERYLLRAGKSASSGSCVFANGTKTARRARAFGSPPIASTSSAARKMARDSAVSAPTGTEVARTSESAGSRERLFLPAPGSYPAGGTNYREEFGEIWP